MNVSCFWIKCYLRLMLVLHFRPVSDLRYPMISDKMLKLGWKPKVPWEEGIRRTSKYFLCFGHTLVPAIDLCFITLGVEQQTV